MQINKGSEVAQQIKEHYPFLLEESVWSSTQSDYVLWLPVETNPNSVFKSELVGIKQLEVVKKIQQNWVEYGTRLERCSKPYLRHNVSNTVDVGEKQWGEVAKYIFDNRNYFTGVSFLGTFGDKDFKQAPFTSVLTAQQILDKYGEISIFASGLIVDGLHAFDNDLWNACQAVTDREFKLSGSRQEQLLQKDWIRRCKQYSKRYFKNDTRKAIYCLKDLHIYHKWVEINRLLKENPPLEISLQQPIYVDVDTMGSAGCVGGQCEMPSSYLEVQKK
jgi:ribonucleoside-diphosphate reductase alpha chain